METQKLALYCNTLQSERGFAGYIALVIVMLSSLLLMTLNNGMVFDYEQSNLLVHREKAIMHVDILEQKLAMAGIKLNDAPASDAEESSMMDCETDCTGLYNQQTLIPILYDGEGHVWMDVTNDSVGINSDTLVCNTFGTDNPQSCLYRAEIFKNSICIDSTCSKYYEQFFVAVFKMTNGSKTLVFQRKLEVGAI